MSSKRIRLAAIIAALALFAAMPVGGGGEEDDHDQRIDFGLPARDQACAGMDQDQEGQEVRASRSSRADPTSASPTSPRAASRSAARRATRLRAIRADWCSPGSRATRSASSRTTSNSLANISTATASGHLQEPGAGRSRTGAAFPARRSAARSTSTAALPTSGTHDAFRNIFLGGTQPGQLRSASKASNGLVAQGVRGRSPGDRLRLAGVQRGSERRSPTTASRAPCATPSRSSTAARGASTS